MKIAIGADHGGFELKEYLRDVLNNLGHEVHDTGCFSTESVDYPVYAEAVCKEIIEGTCEAGLLICGTGIGISIAANRHHQIRAALCHDEYTARLCREHNDANVLCLGARVLGTGVAEGILQTWLTTNFAGGRHQKRILQFSS